MIVIAYILKIVFIITGNMTESFVLRVIFIGLSTIIDAICIFAFLNMKPGLMWRIDLVYLIVDFGFTGIIYQIFHVFNFDKYRGNKY